MSSHKEYGETQKPTKTDSTGFRKYSEKAYQVKPFSAHSEKNERNLTFFAARNAEAYPRRVFYKYCSVTGKKIAKFCYFTPLFALPEDA